MGRIFSPPKPKAAAQIVYVPSPATTVTTPAPSATPAETQPDKTEEEVQSEKAANLLRRNRSRLGTVLTSFKGILSQDNLTTSRKTLLGE